MKKSIFVFILFFVKLFSSFAQSNIDITPQAVRILGNLQVRDNFAVGVIQPMTHVDIQGNVNFRGVNSNVFLTPTLTQAVNFYTGRNHLNTSNPNQNSTDISFQYGGSSGGLKHFLVTRHNLTATNSSSNAFDFYVNNSLSFTGSSDPGVGNLLAMSVTGRGVGIGILNPTEKLEVVGKTKTTNFQMINGATNGGILQSDANGNASWANPSTLTLNINKLAIGTIAPSTERLYVNGDAKIESGLFVTQSLNVGENTTTNNAFVNNGLTVGGSAAIGSLNVSGNTTTVGNAFVNNGLTVGGSAAIGSLNVSGNTTTGGIAFISDKLAIGTTSAPAEKLYVNGSANVNNDLTVGGNTTTGGIAFISDKLAIGTTSAPAEKLYVNGSAKILSDLTVIGKVSAGYVMVSNTFVQQGATLAQYNVNCPAGTVLMGGGGGHQDYNIAGVSITVVYNGPGPDSANPAWQLITSNTSNQPRTIKVYCMCARLD